MECNRIRTPDWLQLHLNDPRTTDICLNGYQGVFVDRGNGLERCEDQVQARLLEFELKDWILEELSAVGKTWDARHPFIDATLRSGHRVHVAFPPLARNGILVSLRKLPNSNLGEKEKIAFSNEFLECRKQEREKRWKSSPFYQLLSEKVRNGDSVLISGATGSGKTTLIGDLLEEVSPNERIIALEDTPELAPRHPHFLSLVSRPPNADGCGEVTLRSLLKQTLRMRPDRIVLGECRGNEVLDLLQTLNTGHQGALATLHANSPRDALRRIELLCLLAGGGSIPITAIRELLAYGVQWIAQVKRMGPERKINEIWKIEGREGDTILLRQVLESSLP